MTEQALMPINEFMPALSLAAAADRYNTLVQYVQAMMKSGLDYGVIPGTGTKPTLYKPGAEKLVSLFGLTPRFPLVQFVEDWTGSGHGGEPFFYYLYKCQLYRGERLIAESDGSCNSWEKKYRYRGGERLCPNCSKPAIIKGKEEYGGGWLCFAKKGGCGAKFKAGDKAIEGQEVGQVKNPDVADLVNTIQKMGQKRALVAATLIAVNASEFFTQDVEDLDIIEGHWTPAPEPPKPAPKADSRPIEIYSPNFEHHTSELLETKPPTSNAPEPAQAEKFAPAKMKVRAEIKEWNAGCAELAQRFPKYAQPNGAPNMFHILGAAGKCGFAVVDDSNYEDAISAMLDRAAEALPA
jgi:hypothetical protein